jgi:hypothetical protein
VTKKGKGKSSRSSSSKAPASPAPAVRREAFEGVEPDVVVDLEAFAARGRAAQEAADAAAPAAPAAPVNLGACCVDGCSKPAIAEVHWPAAAPEMYCADHGELALAGKVVPTSRRGRPRPPPQGGA